MDFVANLIINFHTLFMLAIMYVHSKRSQDDSLPNSLYLAILKTTCLMLIADTLGRMDGLSNSYFPLFNSIGNFFLFVLQPVVPGIWLLYAHLNVFQNRSRTLKLVKPVVIFLLGNLAFTIMSLFNGVYYYIDANNIYHRGPLYLVATSFGITLTTIAFFIVVLNRKIVRPSHFRALYFFPVIPMFAYALQIKFYGYQLAISGIALSLLIVLLRIQNQTIYTDYLTGIYNRKWLDFMTQRLISREESGGNLSAIFIDLDDFKEINDQHGHDEGDRVLKEIALVLQNCLEDLGYVARYGGDEFYILIRHKQIDYIEKVVEKLKGCMSNYNQNNPKGHRIRFSTGYVAYDAKEHKDVAGFQKAVDNLLYLSKRQKQMRRLQEQGKIDD